MIMVYLELFHGRHTPDEKLDKWGFEGPVLGPFPYVHITYGCDINLGDDANENSLTDISVDKDGMVQFAGGYYGDMSVFSSLDTPELKQRAKDTRKVLRTKPALLVSDERDWVKLYCEWRLKNDPNT